MYWITTQTIKPGAGVLCQYRIQAGDAQSSLNLQTSIQPLECCMQNRYSSKKMTLFHSCIQLCSSPSQSCCSSLCCTGGRGGSIVKGSQSNGCWADRLCCCKHQHTVCMKTERAANMPISWLTVHDVAIRFCRTDMSILSGVSHGRALRFCMQFSMTLRNTLILY